MTVNVTLTGVERTFGEDETIVSKTDLKGRITYCNRVFMRVADYDESELLGKPHNIIRHPDMPRAVFKLLWDTIAGGQEIFAYVINRTKFGDHYWVLAHVTPSFDSSGAISGYHSSRRTADRRVLSEHVIPLYKSLLDIERKHDNPKAGLEASFQTVADLLKGNGLEYNEWVFSL